MGKLQEALAAGTHTPASSVELDSLLDTIQSKLKSLDMAQDAGVKVAGGDGKKRPLITVMSETSA